MKQKSFETMLKRLIGLTPDQVESLIATACDIACQKAAVGQLIATHGKQPAHTVAQ